MEYLLIIVVVIVVLIVAKRFFDRKQPEQKQKEAVFYKYLSKDHLMTRSESDFFNMLNEAVGEKYYVFPQVHLSAVLEHKVKGQNWQAAFRHINGKSVDYVLCDKVTLKPVYAVELDDKTHEYTDRQERDKEVERIFAGANLTLVRFEDYKLLDKKAITQRFPEIVHSN